MAVQYAFSALALVLIVAATHQVGVVRTVGMALLSDGLDAKRVRELVLEQIRRTDLSTDALQNSILRFSSHGVNTRFSRPRSGQLML